MKKISLKINMIHISLILTVIFIFGCVRSSSSMVADDTVNNGSEISQQEPVDSTVSETGGTSEKVELQRITQLALASSRLKPGQSVKFPTNALASTLSGMGSMIAWGNTGVWDSVDGKAVWIGKRANSAQYRRLEYNEATNTWSESYNLSQELIDYNIGHGYDGNAIDNETGDLYFRLYTGNVYHWDKAVDVWSNIGRYGGRQCCEAVEWWDGRGLVYSDTFGVSLWNGQTWSSIIPSNMVTGIGYHSVGEYQRNAEVYVFGGGNSGSTKVYKLDKNNNLTLLPPAPFSLGNGSTTQGILVADPVSNSLVAMQRQGLAWAELDPINEVWSDLLISSGDSYTPQDGTPNLSHVETVAIPIVDHGVIMFVSQYGGMNNDVWLYKHSPSSASPTVEITSFDLTSAISGEVPFMVGVGLKKGDVPDTPVLDVDSYQVEVKRRWYDGSAKHVVFSGTYTSTANTPTTITVAKEGTATTGLDLTESDIVTAAPKASVSLGSYGTVSLSALLGTPDRIWLQGPEMVEAHYSEVLSGEGFYLTVKYHVRLYRDGAMFVRAIVENGNMNASGSSDDLPIAPAIAIDGEVVFSAPTMIIDKHQRFDAEKWINIQSPETIVSHDTEYLMASGLVPNYWKKGPSDTALDSLIQKYTPLGNADWTAYMPGPSYHKDIGLFPIWDALYLNSYGDARAYRSVITNTRAINSYPIVWSDPATNSPIIISAHPTRTIYGNNGGGSTSWNAEGLTWDIAHQGSAGYLAYLITGDYYFLETMQYQAALNYLFTHSNRGSGLERVIKPVQTRGVAWATRSYGQVAGIAPLDSFTNDMIAMLDFSAAYWRGVIEQPGMNELGYIYMYESYTTPNDSQGTAPWQHHFWIQTNGYVSDLEYSTDMDNFNFVRDHMYKAVVGISGGNGVDNYCYTRAANYTVAVASSKTSNPIEWYDSWGDVWTTTHGSVNNRCGSVLTGGYIGGPAVVESYWGNFLPALSYAVEDGAPGAVDSLARLTSADNWEAFEEGGWENKPQWGIMPRGFE